LAGRTPGRRWPCCPSRPTAPGRAEALRALAAKLVARLGAGGAGYVVAVVDEMLADAAEKG
jgi:hypothetical protein